MTLKRIVGSLLLLSVAGATAVLTIGWQLARPVPARIGAPPATLSAEPVTFPSESGATVHGWFSTLEAPRGAVLLLPSIRSNRLAMVKRASFLREAGYATLLIDFQATGETPGHMITFGWLERFDVLAAERFLRHRLPGVPVAVIGSSLGGAAALLATPPLNIEALVLEAVYPAIDVAVDNRLRMRVGPLATLLTPLLLMQLQPRIGATTQQLRPIDHMAQIRCPVLLIGGTHDRHTTEADTRRLYEAAPDSKQLWLIPGVGHADFHEVTGDEYRRRVLAFLTIAMNRPVVAQRLLIPNGQWRNLTNGTGFIVEKPK